MNKSIGLNVSCKTLEKPFDSLILSIMLYGCEVLGLDSALKQKNDPSENLHVTFMKDVRSGDSSRTSIPKTMASYPPPRHLAIRAPVGGGGVNFHYKGIYRRAAGMEYTFRAIQFMNGYHILSFLLKKYMNR